MKRIVILCKARDLDKVAKIIVFYKHGTRRCARAWGDLEELS